MESGLRILVTRIPLSPLFLPGGTADVTVVIPILASLTSGPSAGTRVTADGTGMSFRGERPLELIASICYFKKRVGF